MSPHIPIILLLITSSLGCVSNYVVVADQAGYSLHKNVVVTVFWVGEAESSDNRHISNYASAWDIRWTEHYGGVDDPNNRDGFYPAAFVPLENPFYFALPYNDFGMIGRKESAYDRIPWSSDKRVWGDDESMCKNRWIMIIHDSKVAYAQWEDAGPFEYDDVDYVFGDSPPKSKINGGVGLDVSPAVRDYLGLSDIDAVDWQFVEQENVPDGPWKKIVTTSPITWH